MAFLYLCVVITYPGAIFMAESKHCLQFSLNKNRLGQFMQLYTVLSARLLMPALLITTTLLHYYCHHYLLLLVLCTMCTLCNTHAQFQSVNIDIKTAMQTHMDVGCHCARCGLSVTTCDSQADVLLKWLYC